MAPEYLYDFDPEAENNTAATIYRLVREGGERVLDLGSGPGIVAAALQREAGKEVTCLDSSIDHLARARDAGVSRTVHADLDDPSWADAVGEGPYDVAVLADVLEHLYHPGAVLDTIRERQLLAADGFIVVSIPNAAHEAVIGSLVAGDFTYTETGLLDATHIRFFTRRTFLNLCETHGYTISRLHRTVRSLEQTEKFGLTPDVSQPLRRALSEGSADHRTYQYVARVVPLDEPGRLRAFADQIEELREQRVSAVEQIRGEKHGVEKSLRELRLDLEQREQMLADQRNTVERLRAERDDAVSAERSRAASVEAELRSASTEAAQRWRIERTRLEQETSRLQGQLAEAQDLNARWESQVDAAGTEVARIRTEINALRARAEKLRIERDTVAAKEREARRKVQQVYDSETWRVGEVLLRVPKLLRGLVRRGPGPKPAPSVEPQERSDESIAAVGSRAHRLTLREHTTMRQAYESAVARRGFSGAAVRSVVMGVSTTDLDAGRGDLYTAIGLGRRLEARGYEVVYLGKDDWYDLPEGTGVFVSMLAEKTAMLDPLALPVDVLRIAWVRNLTERWAASGTLPFYDGILCSSVPTQRAIRRSYGGPLSLLRIGVDPDLFTGAEPRDHAPVAVSTVNSWGQERSLHTALAAIDKSFLLTLYGQQRGTPDQLRPWTADAVSFFSLPSLYSQAALVLDDQQNVNREYGNVNSRVYESLACGALPISNSGVGLQDVGLAALPVYDEPDQLRRLISDHLADSDRRAERVAELRAVVLRDHTYEQRAITFDRFLDEEIAGAARTDRTIIGFTPDYRVTNPYQDMLYARARDHGALAIPMADPVHVADSPILQGRRLVFHIHWTATILGPATSEREADDRRRRFVADLDALRAAGAKILWTVHNVLPHECSYPTVERRLSGQIAQRADAIHVMCAETPQLVADEYELPQDKVRVIPHGSYIDVHPNLVDGERARRELGLSSDHTVLLFLGGIRPYKGVEQLLEAFEQISHERPDYRLVMAGMPGRFQGVEELRRRCESHPAILPRFELIPDQELQLCLNAADVIVLPHRRVLNSGGLMMAWSFGRPVIAPRAGCVAGQVSEGLGLTFDPEGEDFAEVLRRADELKGDGVRAACYAAAVSYPYTAMSEDYFALVEELFADANG